MKMMPQEAGSDFVQTYMENAKKYWSNLNGDIGLSILPPTKKYPLRLVEYVGLTDSASLRDLTLNMVASANEMLKAAASDPDTPIEIELSMGEARDYRGVAVDSVTYGVIPGGQMAGMWPEMLPKQLKAEMAWVPNGVLVSIGDPSQTDGLVDRVLDGTSTPISALDSWKTAYPMPEKNLSDVSHISIFNAIRSYMELFDTYSDEPSGNADMIPAGPGNLETVSYMALGGMMSRLRFSLADITAISQKVQEVQKAQQQQQEDFMKQMQTEMDGMDDEDFQTVNDEEFEEWTAGDDDVEAPAAPMAPTPAPAR